MPLYKLFCIAAHYPEYRHLKDLVHTSAKFLFDRGSAVREIRYLGLKNLPQSMRRHKHVHTIGDYWIMNFDTSPTILHHLTERMQTDHRVIRWTTLKLGEKLTDVADTQQSTISFSRSLHTTPEEIGVWSNSASGPGIPLELLQGSYRGLLTGSGSQGNVGVEGRVAGLGGVSVASLGGARYARDRIPS